jgi:hypothetical protein
MQNMQCVAAGWIHTASPVRTARGWAVSLRVVAHGWFALKQTMLGLPSYIPLIRALSFNFVLAWRTYVFSACLALGRPDTSPGRMEVQCLHPRRIGRPRASKSRPATRDSIPSRLRPYVKPTVAPSPPSSPSSAALCLSHASSPVLTSHLLCNTRPTIATYAIYS